MTTPEEVEAFVRRTRPPWNVARQAYDWYGMCAGLTYRTISECGGYVPDDPYGSAWLAYLAAREAGRIESRDFRAAPPGAIHYFDYVGMASNGQRARWGHVVIDILGGGTDCLSATGHAHEVWAKSAGLISIPAQAARGMEYVGWARTYGSRIRLTITRPAPVDGGATPLPSPVPEPEEGDIEMRHIYNTDNPDNETRRATVGELTFHVVGPLASARERVLWGAPVSVDNGGWATALDMVNTRRAMAGLPPLKGVRGEFSVPTPPA